MLQICLMFFTFLLSLVQADTVKGVNRHVVSASEATLLTTASLVDESLKESKINDEFYEIPVETLDVSNVSKKKRNRTTKTRFKIAKVFTNCTREIFELRVELNRPFYGLLYAKEFPQECRARGTSDANITLRLPTSGCGVRVEPRHDGSMELSVRIMMQMEEKLRQSSDILKTVKCKLPVTAMGMLLAGVESKSKNDLRHGRMQNANHYLHKTTQTIQQLNAGDMETTHFPPTYSQSSIQYQFTNAHSSQTPRVRIWLELSGPDGSGSVVVGQATTLIVRAIVPGTMDVRIVDCAALDGLGESTQQLLDDRGCPIDEQICDYDLKILGGFARFGGSTHDSYIWEASRINVILQQRYEADRRNTSWLLGDSGYPLRPWLMTPYRSASEDERRFNKAHAKARNCIERLNGVLKGVFRCLQVGLKTSPQMAGKIINACTVLHNFRLAHGLLVEDDIINTESASEIISHDEEQFPEPLREACRLRDRLKINICSQHQR